MSGDGGSSMGKKKSLFSRPRPWERWQEGRKRAEGRERSGGGVDRKKGSRQLRKGRKKQKFEDSKHMSESEMRVVSSDARNGFLLLRTGQVGYMPQEQEHRMSQPVRIQTQDVKLQQLHGLLDFALKQKAEEDVQTSRQLKAMNEVIVIKDEANKALRGNLAELEERLSECRMELEYYQEQWKSETAEKAILKKEAEDLRKRDDERRKEIEALKNQLAAANNKVNCARNDALDHLHANNELEAKFEELSLLYIALQNKYNYFLESLADYMVKEFPPSCKPDPSFRDEPGPRT
eukprot:757443-Hanusia_phi.AAC.2